MSSCAVAGMASATPAAAAATPTRYLRICVSSFILFPWPERTLLSGPPKPACPDYPHRLHGTLAAPRYGPFNVLQFPVAVAEMQHRRHGFRNPGKAKCRRRDAFLFRCAVPGGSPDDRQLPGSASRTRKNPRNGGGTRIHWILFRVYPHESGEAGATIPRCLARDRAQPVPGAACTRLPSVPA